MEETLELLMPGSIKIILLIKLVLLIELMAETMEWNVVNK
jgi:hypothetical protein